MRNSVFRFAVLVLLLLGAEGTLAKEKTSLSDFTNFYQATYDQTGGVDLTELYNRLDENKSIEGVDSSNQEISEYVAPASSTSNFKDHFSRSSEIEAVRNFEALTFLFEEDLRETLSEMSIFANGTLSDSPYDLIVDLNKIDGVLFGEKFDDLPDPTFARPYTLGGNKSGLEFDSDKNFEDQRFGDEKKILADWV